MSNFEADHGEHEDSFDKLISSIDLTDYAQFDRISDSRDRLETHNEMVMNALVKMTIDFHEDSIPEAESVMINNIFYMYEYAREVTKVHGTYEQKRDAIVDFLYKDNDDKINQLSMLLDSNYPFTEVVSKDEITQIMEEMKLECGGDVSVLAARVYRGMTAHLFSRYCAEAFGIGT